MATQLPVRPAARGRSATGVPWSNTGGRITAAWSPGRRADQHHIIAATVKLGRRSVTFFSRRALARRR